MATFQERVKQIYKYFRGVGATRFTGEGSINIYSQEQLSSLANKIATLSMGALGTGRVDAKALTLKDSYIARLHDYDMMDDYDMISAAFDIYSEEATLRDLHEKKMIWIESKDATINRMLTKMFDRIEIEKHLPTIARAIVKYGNDFERVVVDTVTNQVIALDYLNAYSIRIYDLPKFGRFYTFKFSNELTLEGLSTFDYSPVELENMIERGQRVHEQFVILDGWSVVHFRYRGKYRNDLYGYSLVESARSTWKRLIMIENAMLFRKLQRSISKYVFYVRTGQVQVADAMQKLRQFAMVMKRTKRLNELLNNVDVKYDMWVDDDDFYIPVMDEHDPTRIETLEGLNYDSSEEVEYYLNKLFASLRIPKTYLSFEDVPANRSTLGTEDMRFAKSVISLQQVMQDGLRQICDLELLLHGIDPAKVKYELQMTSPSAIFELASLEADKVKLDVASSYKDFASIEWIQRHVLGWSDGDVAENAKYAKQEGSQPGAEQPIPGAEQGAPIPGAENPTEQPAEQPAQPGEENTSATDTFNKIMNNEEPGADHSIMPHGSEPESNDIKDYEELPPIPTKIGLGDGKHLFGRFISSKKI